MFRYKSHKKAIIMTALVILLCLVSLTGATLALFTSTLSDGTIGIITTAGDVEVSIVDAITGESLVGKTLQFETTSLQQEILFEPGAAFYTQGFKVKNIGNIPINFRLSVSEDEDIDMTEFHEAFEVWITTEPTRLYEAEPINGFQGKLDPEKALAENPLAKTESDTYYLVIRMKESVGNEFQGKTYSGIGITVYAVQGNAGI